MTCHILDSIRTEILGPGEAEEHVDQLGQLYESDFVEPPLQGTYGFSKERFRKMLVEQYIKKPNFTAVTLWGDDQLIGFVTGNSLVAETQWWNGVKEPLPPRFTEENGERTASLKDIVIKRSLRGQGFASLIHGIFLRERREERVTLLSSPERQPAYSILQHWGYRKVGTTGAVEDRGVMEVFIRPIGPDNVAAGA